MEGGGCDYLSRLCDRLLEDLRLCAVSRDGAVECVYSGSIVSHAVECLEDVRWGWVGVWWGRRQEESYREDGKGNHCEHVCGQLVPITVAGINIVSAARVCRVSDDNNLISGGQEGLLSVNREGCPEVNHY